MVLERAGGPVQAFAGMEIIFSPHAHRSVAHENYPISRHRSARIEKKLLRRFGIRVVHREEPAILRLDDKLVVHPSLGDALYEAVKTEGEATPPSSVPPPQPTGPNPPDSPFDWRRVLAAATVPLLVTTNHTS